VILNLSLNLPEDGAFLRIARLISRTMLESLGIVAQDVDDVELVVEELCSNVIRHAQSNNGRFLLVINYYADRVVVVVEDTGHGFSFKDVRAVGEERPDLDGSIRLGGFGIGLVAALTSRLEFFRTDPHGTTVRAEILLHYDSKAEAAEAADLDNRSDGGANSISASMG
jgi:serine/threonine-protein kinase RsbW